MIGVNVSPNTNLTIAHATKDCIQETSITSSRMTTSTAANRIATELHKGSMRLSIHCFFDAAACAELMSSLEMTLLIAQAVPNRTLYNLQKQLSTTKEQIIISFVHVDIAPSGCRKQNSLSTQNKFGETTWPEIQDGPLLTWLKLKKK